jgi:hypothetical protein
MSSKDLKNSPKVLGLDISTKTIGWSLFDIQTQKLLELTHFSPVIKPKPEDKIEELLKKVDAFEEKLQGYKDLGITKVIIEEPLLNSNNVWTVGTLLRYNSMISKSIYDILGVIPNYISTYNSRKFAWPELVQDNGKGKRVLFGGLPKDIDKKELIWKKVSEAEPQIVWLYTRNNTLKKECFDQADAYTCVQGYMKQNGLW